MPQHHLQHRRRDGIATAVETDRTILARTSLTWPPLQNVLFTAFPLPLSSCVTSNFMGMIGHVSSHDETRSRHHFLTPLCRQGLRCSPCGVCKHPFHIHLCVGARRVMGNLRPNGDFMQLSGAKAAKVSAVSIQHAKSLWHCDYETSNNTQRGTTSSTCPAQVLCRINRSFTT